MDCNNPPPPGEVIPNNLSESGYLFPRGQPFNNAFNAVLPPRFWRPPPPHLHSFGPQIYPHTPVPPFLRGPPVYSVPPPRLPSSNQAYSSVSNICISKAEDDETWLKNWLQSRPVHKLKNYADSTGISISEARVKLKHWSDLLKKLEDAYASLERQSGTITKTEWSAAWTDIEEMKSNVAAMTSSLLSEKQLAELQKKVHKQVRKRSRLKRQHTQQRKDAHLAEINRQTLHKKADAWLADMQLAVDRLRNDEKIKKKADSVLSEVTRRQTEGRRQIALLEALQKLHHARIHAAEARGSKFSAEDKDSAAHSALVFDQLLKMWSRKMDEYSKEEHGLKIMLEESAAKQSDLEIQNVRDTLEDWNSFLFGTGNSGTPDEINDINTLVSIRYAWDQYTVPDEVPMSSTIPVGWVLPTTPSSVEWQHLLPK